MRYLKILGLAAIAASALTAFAAPVSATVLTNGEGTEIVHLTFSMKEKTSASLGDTQGNPLDKCTESEVSGQTNNQTMTWVEGSAHVTWGGCSNTTDTINGGTTDIMSNFNGTAMVVSTGAEVTINPPIIGSCVYGTKSTAEGGTTLGTLSSGTQPVLSISVPVEEKPIKRLACPDTARWIAEYKVTEPHDLVID